MKSKIHYFEKRQYLLDEFSEIIQVISISMLQDSKWDRTVVLGYSGRTKTICEASCISSILSSATVGQEHVGKNFSMKSTKNFLDLPMSPSFSTHKFTFVYLPCSTPLHVAIKNKFDICWFFVLFVKLTCVCEFSGVILRKIHVSYIHFGGRQTRRF